MLKVQAQDLDSLLAAPQTLELTISTPQPRLDEKFQISLDVNYVRAHIFKSAIGKIELTGDVSDNENGRMVLNVHALEKG